MEEESQADPGQLGKMSSNVTWTPLTGWTLEEAEVAARDRKIWGHFLRQAVGALIYLFILSLTRVTPSVTGTDLQGGPAYNSSSKMEGENIKYIYIFK